MLDALGLEESGLDKLIKKSYDLLGLMSFLTAGETEVRAWTITKGTHSGITSACSFAAYSFTCFTISSSSAV